MWLHQLEVPAQNDSMDLGSLSIGMTWTWIVQLCYSCNTHEGMLPLQHKRRRRSSEGDKQAVQPSFSTAPATGLSTMHHQAWDHFATAGSGRLVVYCGI